MADIVKIMEGIENGLIKAELYTIDNWKKLRHTKAHLEILLKDTVSVIEFRPKEKKEFERIICTSNTKLINVYKAAKKTDKEKKLHTNNIGIFTKDPKSVMTYDLIDDKLKTVQLDSWKVVNSVAISEKNILVLDTLIKECLKRK